MMNIREILVDLSKDASKSSESEIAKVILKNLNLGIFKSQKELAKECFVSESVLTKFSKKLGLSGFRELNFNLKENYNKYYNHKHLKNKNADFQFHKNVFERFQELVDSNKNFFTQIFLKIKNSKKIVIASSYCLNSNAIYAVELFNQLGIEAVFQENRILSNRQITENIQKLPVLILLAGQDNTFLCQAINLLDENLLRENLFVITSESQAKKITCYNQLLILENQKEYINWVYRKPYIDYILLTIYSLFN